ncbi:MAG: hypothetical protein WCK75_02240 [Elusimicrobiota bacterium]
MNKYLFLPLALLSVIATSVPVSALPPEKGFFLGGGYGKSSLNNDLSIYSIDNNARQPTLNIRQSTEEKNTAPAAFVGYNFAGTETNILGKGRLQLGAQVGYVDLGEYIVKAHYYEATTSSTGYRSINENATDLLLTSSLYWENGFNVFLKAGVARLHGVYTQYGLLTARQPEFVPEKETFTYTVYRPELVLGTGVLLFNRCNLFLQYVAILGPTPNTSNDRFGTSEMVEMPNTLYKADYFTVGVTLYI